VALGAGLWLGAFETHNDLGLRRGDGAIIF